MKYLEVKEDLASFTNLNDLGITNFFSFSNKRWGDFNLKKLESVSKFNKIFNILNIPNETTIYIQAEHNDNVRIIDKLNLNIYKSIQKPKNGLLKLSCDGIITKESIPIIITPGDCVLILLTAIDKKDGRRFVIFIHAGLTGAILDILKKSMKLAKDNYEFDLLDLKGYIFPYIKGLHFLKDTSDTRLELIKEDPQWQPYLIPINNKVGIDFGKKIEDDLRILNVPIETAILDTYDENVKGRLYSQNYLRSINEDETQRFAIGVFIR